MTPAITLLKKKKVPFEVLQYSHDSNASSYGLEAADKLNLDANSVFKTLVVADDNNKHQNSQPSMKETPGGDQATQLVVTNEPLPVDAKRLGQR